MDWRQRLKLLVLEDNKRGRITLKLLDKDAEYRATLFDDNDDAVRASLLCLIEPAAAGDMESVLERKLAPVLESMKEGFSQLTPAVESMKSMLLERCSATRPASRINDEDLRSLRTTLGVVGPIPKFYDPSSVSTLDTLLRNDSAGAETFWDDRYEVQQEEEYVKALKACIPGRRNHLEWKSATAKTIKKTFKDVDFPVSASNDVVLCVKRLSTLLELGAILGVELQKKLTWQGIRQAEVEYYLWAESSLFPFVQLITDMEQGGVAFYSRGGCIVHMLIIGSMEGVRGFLRELGKHIPPELGQDDPDDERIVCPDALSEPSRKKFKSSGLGENSSGQQQPGSQTPGQVGSQTSARVALWTMAARWKNNRYDIGNMRDFEGFDIVNNVDDVANIGLELTAV